MIEPQLPPAPQPQQAVTQGPVYPQAPQYPQPQYPQPPQGRPQAGGMPMMMSNQNMMPGMPPGMVPMPYPPQGYPPQPPPRRGGVGRAIFMTMLVVLLLGSFALNLVLLVVNVAGAGAGVGGAMQQTVHSGNSGEKLVIVPLKGLIDGNLSAQFDRFMKMAESDKAVKAVVIEIDSPGGTVTASDEIYHRINSFKTRRAGVPVVVSMGSLATSGGYYAACAADHVVAQPTTFTGNIGVLMPRYNFSKLMEKYGVEETTIVSSGAPFKNAGSSFRPESAEEKQYMQELADSAFSQFKTVVSNGRGSKLKAKLDDVANGKVFTSPSALNLGLIDQIGYGEDAQNHAKSAAGLSNPTVVRYYDPPSFLQVLMSSKAGDVATFASGGGKGGNINVTIDSDLLRELTEFTTPRPLYLWRGQ
jgi:protease-4